MYQLTEQQIDFIMNDIRARGVMMESLQHDLMDHVCCIIENQLEATGDFERFYESVITTFYRKELREIEDETISLLTHKNFYVMKKFMIVSGIISAAFLTMGIIFKFLHMPGAATGIFLGIVLFSFLFLPLMFTLKIKEKQQVKDKILLGLGTLVASLISMAILFKLMHWPFANMMGIISLGLLLLIYLPVNLVTGLRNPDTKINTIVTSILLVAGCGLFMALARTPQSSVRTYIKNTDYFVRNEQLFKNELEVFAKASAHPQKLSQQAVSIIRLCDEIKSFILKEETGYAELNSDFESKKAWIGETLAEVYFYENASLTSSLRLLKENLEAYNNEISKSGSVNRKIPIGALQFDNNSQKVIDVLNNLVQVEMFVLQAEADRKAS